MVQGRACPSVWASPGLSRLLACEAGGGAPRRLVFGGARSLNPLWIRWPPGKEGLLWEVPPCSVPFWFLVGLVVGGAGLEVVFGSVSSARRRCPASARGRGRGMSTPWGRAAALSAAGRARRLLLHAWGRRRPRWARACRRCFVILLRHQLWRARPELSLRGRARAACRRHRRAQVARLQIHMARCPLLQDKVWHASQRRHGDRRPCGRARLPRGGGEAVR